MRAAALAACLTLSAFFSARAQESLSFRPTRRDTLPAASTVTAVFTVTNGADSAVALQPTIEVPAGWTVITGAAPLPVAARATEMLMLSVAVPARAAAGIYPIRVRLAGSTNPAGIGDSVWVAVRARRALDIGVVDRPGFIVAGRTYETGFLVRNRGNLPSRVRLTARSSVGQAINGDTILQLDVDEAHVVRVRVRTPHALESATDDVVEVTATYTGDSLRANETSARVTIVPEPGRTIEEYLRLPTTVRLRAASSQGVSPFEVIGGGLLRDRGATRVDFLMRGPTGQFSAFGERDEYRLNLTAPGWRARIGDQFYMLTPLTGGAQPGFGAGAEGTRGSLAFGAHGQQFRRAPDKGTEVAAYVAGQPIPDARLSLNAVNRVGGALPGRVGSASASYGRGIYRAEAELARSNSAHGSANANSVRLGGATSHYSFDFGHQLAEANFSSAQRGSTHDYVTASARPSGIVSFALNGGSHRTDLSQSTGTPYKERMDAGTVAATFLDQYTVELGGVARATSIQGVRSVGRQHGVRTRTDQPTAFATVSAEAEIGRARDGAIAPRTFTHFSLGARRVVTRGNVGVWTEKYSGGAITQGLDGTVTVGGDASVRLSRTLDMTLTGYATRIQTAGSTWQSQLDALLSHTLRNGSSISLRARIFGGAAYRSKDQSVAYLEYGIPLRLPVSRLRTPGRVYGRVVDAATGQGVAGALVRLGPQVAITDRQGEVAFGGVPGGEHRLSMSQETSFADAVFVGDPTLMVDSTREQPTTFRLAIARSARIDIDVRRFAVARTGIAGSADSLADAGPLANASLLLVGDRDTLYRTTNDAGRVSFTDIPPGSWKLAIRGDAPAFHRFEPDRLDMELAPGETKGFTFRLVPRRREVQLIGDGQELKPTPTTPKTATQPGTRIVKPNDQKHDR